MKNRESNIELLRLVLMLMIVIVHFLGHNILSASNSITSNNAHFFSSNLLFSLVVCAVDCFVLISGWFSIKFSVTKLIMFLLPICLYQFLISLVYHPFGAEISINPFAYWFIPPYVALMIMSPILNRGINALSKKAYIALLACLTLIFILPLDSLSGMHGKNSFIFIYIYCLGFFLKKHFSNRYSQAAYFTSFVIATLLIFAETIGLEKINRFEGSKTLSYSYDNILIVLAAVFLFLTFNKMKVKSVIINKLSASAFFVYIITENTNCWKHSTHSIYKLMDVAGWENSSYYILLILVASILTFVTALVIDLFRRAILYKPMMFFSSILFNLEARFVMDNKSVEFKRECYVSHSAKKGVDL